MAFKKGESGNQSGRPKGATNKRSRMIELLEPKATELINRALDMALAGNEQMLKLLLDRVLPKLKDEPLSPINLVGNLSEKGEQVLALIAKGELTTSEGTALMQAISTQAQLISIDELIKRVEQLENVKNATNKPK